MRQTRARVQKVPLDIFQAHQVVTDWRTLPGPIRHQTAELLAQLFRVHQQRLFSATGKNKELRDE